MPNGHYTPGSYVPTSQQRPSPDTEDFWPHFVRFLVIGLLMGIATYPFFVGWFWWMHAARRTGFRARDAAFGPFLFIPWLIWGNQILWRYTAKTMYWTPRPEYMSRPLSPSNPTPATPAFPDSRWPAVPPGWYSDPTGRYEWRYWDGTKWTSRAASHGVETFDEVQVA